MAIAGFSTSLARAVPLAVLLATGLAGISAFPAAAQEKAIVREKNPPGDIPDNQVFVTYNAPQGFSLKVPEGWARADAGDSVSFADKYGRIDVTVTTLHAPLTAASVRANEAAELEKAGRAVKISAISEVKLPAGPAVRIVYSSNSDRNPVTNKQIRVESERFLIGHNDKVAALTFSAPAGADNADQWTLMSKSFRWQ